jgi:hypothetical protein
MGHDVGLGAIGMKRVGVMAAFMTTTDTGGSRDSRNPAALYECAWADPGADERCWGRRDKTKRGGGDKGIGWPTGASGFSSGLATAGNA